MKGEKKYVITENQLLNFLVSDMLYHMNERDGVDSWPWYGTSYKDIVEEYYPGDWPPTDEDGEPVEVDMWDCAKARLEAGEFQEQFDIEEFVGNLLIDLDNISDYESMN